MRDLITPANAAKIKEAQKLLADVQIDMLHADKKLPKSERNDWWHVLYSIRLKLGQFAHDHRPSTEFDR